MFGEKNISKFLQRYRDSFGFNIELEWCSMRRKNRHILIVNAGKKIDEALYQLILGFIRECERQNFFKRLEFLAVFPDPQDDQEVKRLNEYWVLRLKEDTRNRRIFSTNDLIITFI